MYAAEYIGSEYEICFCNLALCSAEPADIFQTASFKTSYILQ